MAISDPSYIATETSASASASESFMPSPTYGHLMSVLLKSLNDGCLAFRTHFGNDLFDSCQRSHAVRL